MNTISTASQSTARSHHRSATPWAVRVLLVVSILFGIWVDVSNVGSTASNDADRNQVHLLGLTTEHSTVGAIVKTLASRRS